MFPTYGFGGKVPNAPETIAKVSHCFALNGNIFKPESSGVNGVLNAYYSSLNKIKLFGPTHFSEILEHVNGFAHSHSMEMSQNN